MKKIIILSLLLLISKTTFAQAELEIINPKGNFYLGAEIGLNIITSFSQGEQNKSFQGGLLAEYYFAKQWSILGRIKYFETGVSFIKDTSNSFDYANYTYNRFDGAIVSVPIDVKWEYRIFNNFKGNIKQGFAYNYETKSNYDFAPNVDTNNSKSFGSLNFGFGFSYFISKKTAFYVDFETYQLGGYKGNNSGFILPKNYYTNNTLLNFGVKYNLKHK